MTTASPVMALLVRCTSCYRLLQFDNEDSLAGVRCRQCNGFVLRSCASGKPLFQHPFELHSTSMLECQSGVCDVNAQENDEARRVIQAERAGR